ncbi:DUF1922 domain-containing protein [Mycolicibacter virginiensis]|uniref:DUF1922 domain-containing protein n=1 Tax=Mycolicibacter virginiensis TaxID=1795032 RepID=A0A9X7IM55_9MYCO|nr:DUF1922 domain-containing protein [Mycolicibacter virginiensis]PQM51816.1 DUF1922 domain-containing protein [Mycolicibacter virginiensis]
MITCQHCRRTTQNYLCDDCTDALDDMLSQIPWLLEELDNRIQRLDRTTTGTIGRSRGPDELSVIDFDAAKLARTTRTTLLNLAETVAHIASGRTPRLETVTTGDLALWIACKLPHIVRHHTAGNTYRIIDNLVGSDQQGGQLVRAINPIEHHLVGPCPTITGRDHLGYPRQCGHVLFADTYDRTVTCPACQQEIDVERTRLATAQARDHHTREDLLDLLTNIDEPVNPNQLDRWITARRLRPTGWLHDGTITEFRLNPAAEPVYSLDRARKLRRRDDNLRARGKARA